MAANLRTWLQEWDRQPQEVVELRGRYRGGYVALPGTHGLKSVGAGDYTYQQLHSSSVRRIEAEGARLIADHGGSVDDRFGMAQNVPSPRAVSGTTIVAFDFANSGHDDVKLLPTGHAVRCTGSTLVVGYAGGNGYDYLYYYPWYSNTARVGFKCVFVISHDNYNDVLTVAVQVNGVAIARTSTVGSPGYMGQGSIALESAPYLGETSYTNYYHPSGLLRLWGYFPGVVIGQAEANSIAANPWQIFEPRRIIVPVPAAAPSTGSRLRTWTQEWDRQPQEATNLADAVRGPAAHRLVGALPIDATGLLSELYVPTGVAAPATPIVGTPGRGVRFSGAEGAAFTPAAGVITADDYALVAVVRRGETVGSTQWIFGTSDNFGSLYRNISFTSSNTVRAIFRSSGTTRQLEGTTSFGAGSIVSIVMVSRSTTNKALFVNGVLEDATMSGAKTGGGGTIVLGSKGVTGSQTDWLHGDIFLATYLPNVASLPNEYFRELSANPWQIFEPRRIVIPVAVAGGATVPFLSSLTTTNITATTARLGLTLTF